MSELRVDPLSGLRVLVDDDGWAPPPAPARTAPDAGAAGACAPSGPLLLPDADAPPRSAAPELFTAVAARGHHELVPHAAEPGTTLAALGPEGLAAAMARWRERMAARPEAAHLHLQVTEGGTAAASSRAELLALDFVPAAVARERERAGAYATRTQGSDLLGDLVQAEVRERARLVAYDDEAVLLAPYASRAAYQLMLVPRTPAPRFEAPGVLGASLLHHGPQALERRVGRAPALVLWVRTAPRGAAHFCWRIDVLPRLDEPTALELGVGLPVLRVAPERATAELRQLT